jgi:hypothetical protein
MSRHIVGTSRVRLRPSEYGREYPVGFGNERPLAEGQEMEDKHTNRRTETCTGARAAAAAITIAAMAAIGCESADRRSMNDAIDQREAVMAERAEVFESFEAELAAELRDEYGATAEEGCPEMEPLPTSGSAALSLGLPSDEEMAEREAQATAREEAFERNLPGERCRCLQGTIAVVRTAIEQSGLQGFAEEREAIASISDEALTQRIAIVGLPATDVRWAEEARERVSDWKRRRHDDWTDSPSAWGDDQEPFGWENFNLRVSRRRYNAQSERPVLRDLRWNYADKSCSRF